MRINKKQKKENNYNKADPKKEDPKKKVTKTK
jgi:hypothetical protein